MEEIVDRKDLGRDTKNKFAWVSNLAQTPLLRERILHFQRTTRGGRNAELRPRRKHRALCEAARRERAEYLGSTQNAAAIAR